jgi:hypothetical protein
MQPFRIARCCERSAFTAKNDSRLDRDVCSNTSSKEYVSCDTSCTQDHCDWRVQESTLRFRNRSQEARTAAAPLLVVVRLVERGNNISRVVDLIASNVVVVQQSLFLAVYILIHPRDKMVHTIAADAPRHDATKKSASNNVPHVGL